MKLTPTQAAKRWKKSKATIYNRMNDGTLSFTVEQTGKRPKKYIDVTELLRVWGPEDEQDDTANDNKQTYPSDQINFLLHERIEDLKRENDYLKERITKLESSNAAKDDKILELLREIQGDFTKLLEDKRQPEKKGLFDIFK
jgi:hypothetical protein